MVENKYHHLACLFLVINGYGKRQLLINDIGLLKVISNVLSY